jgi:hypothetical protein
LVQVLAACWRSILSPVFSADLDAFWRSKVSVNFIFRCLLLVYVWWKASAIDNNTCKFDVIQFSCRFGCGSSLDFMLTKLRGIISIDAHFNRCSFQSMLSISHHHPIVFPSSKGV